MMVKTIEIQTDTTPESVVSLAAKFGLTPEQMEEIGRSMAEFLLLDDFLEKTTLLTHKEVYNFIYLGMYAEWVSKGREMESRFPRIYAQILRLLVSKRGKRAEQIVELGHPLMSEKPRRRGFFRR